MLKLEERGGGEAKVAGKGGGKRGGGKLQV